MTAAQAWSSEVELHLTYHYLHRNIKKKQNHIFNTCKASLPLSAFGCFQTVTVTALA